MSPTRTTPTTRAKAKATASSPSKSPARPIKTYSFEVTEEDEECPNKARNFYLEEYKLAIFMNMKAREAYLVNDKGSVTQVLYWSGDFLGARCQHCQKNKVRCEYPDAVLVEPLKDGRFVLRLPTCKCCKAARRSCNLPLWQAPPTPGAMQKRKSRHRNKALPAKKWPIGGSKPRFDGSTEPLEDSMPLCEGHKACDAGEHYKLHGELPPDCHTGKGKKAHSCSSRAVPNSSSRPSSGSSRRSSSASSQAASSEPQSYTHLSDDEAATHEAANILWLMSGRGDEAASPASQKAGTPRPPSSPPASVSSAFSSTESVRSLSPFSVAPQLSVCGSPRSDRSTTELVTPPLRPSVRLPSIADGFGPESKALAHSSYSPPPIPSTYSAPTPTDGHVPMLSIPSGAVPLPDSLQVCAIAPA